MHSLQGNYTNAAAHISSAVKEGGWLKEHQNTPARQAYGQTPSIHIRKE